MKTKQEKIYEIYEIIKPCNYRVTRHQPNIDINDFELALFIGDVLDYVEKIKTKQDLESCEYYAGLYDLICIKWQNKRLSIED